MKIMDKSEWIEAQKQRLLANSELYGPRGCLLCKLGGERSKYSSLTVTFPWNKKKKTVKSHRFSYMLFVQNFDIPTDMHVSHRCHNNRCVNAEHLSLEPDHVNKDRQICRGIFPVHCKKHPPYQDCLL